MRKIVSTCPLKFVLKWLFINSLLCIIHPNMLHFNIAFMSWSWPITLLEHTVPPSAKPITKIISSFASSVSPRSHWPLVIVGIFFPCFQCRQPNFLATRINVCQAGRPMLIYIFSFPKPPLPKEREVWLLSSWWAPGDESRLQDSSLGFGESVLIWLAPCVSGLYELIWPNSFTLSSKGCVYTDQMQQKEAMVIYRNRLRSGQCNWHC